MESPYGIGPNPYVTSTATSFLTQECVHKPLLRSPIMTSKSGYWSLLPCSHLRERQAHPFRTVNSSPDPLCMHVPES